MPRDRFVMPVAFISKLAHRGHLPCIAEAGHIPKGAQDKAAQSIFLALRGAKLSPQTTDGDNT